MGYNTIFKGNLKFKTELTATQLAKVKSFLGEDCREHPEWNVPELTYIDLVFLDDFSGLKWDENTEKTYDLVEKVNFITKKMREGLPDFSFTGKLSAQGEDCDDRWELIIDDKGRAFKKEILPTGTKTICPSCEYEFYV